MAIVIYTACLIMDVIWCFYHRALTLFQKDFSFVSLQGIILCTLKNDLTYQKLETCQFQGSQNAAFVHFGLKTYFKTSEISMELSSAWQLLCMHTHHFDSC